MQFMQRLAGVLGYAVRLSVLVVVHTSLRHYIEKSRNNAHIFERDPNGARTAAAGTCYFIYTSRDTRASASAPYEPSKVSLRCFLRF